MGLQARGHGRSRYAPSPETACTCTSSDWTVAPPPGRCGALAGPPSSEEEVDRAGRAEGKAPDCEWDQRARLEVAEQEADGEVGGRGRAERCDERLSTDAVAGRAE